MRELFDGSGRVDVERSWNAVQQSIETGKAPGSARRRRWMIAGGIVSAAAIGATAAAVAMLPIEDRQMAECRSYTSAGKSIEGAPVALNTGRVDDALRLCAAMWEDGLLRKDAEGALAPEPGSHGHPGRPFAVPPLVLCVEPGEGFAVVVVGDDQQACREAGVVPAGPGTP